MWRKSWGAVVAALMAFGVLFFHALPVDARAQWSPEALPIAPPSNADPEFPFARLRMVSCGAPGSCTAAGTYNDSESNFQAQAISKVDGSWQSAVEVAAAPGYERPHPTDISCASAADCTLVGQLYDASEERVAAVASRTGGTWSTFQPLTLPAGAEESWLSAVSCASPANCVAVGSFEDSAERTYAMTVTKVDGLWGTPVPVGLPSAAEPTASSWMIDVDCPTAESCGAFGGFDDEGDPMAMMLSSTSAGWQQAVAVQGPEDSLFTPRDLACGGVGSCVAVGSYPLAGEEHPAVVEATGGAWAAAAAPLPLPGNASSPNHHADAATVSCFGPGSCVATGNYEDEEAIDRAFVARQVAGSWMTADQLPVPGTPEPTSPYHLVGMTAIDCVSAESCAAIGFAYWRAATYLADGSGFAPGNWIVLPDDAQSQEAGALYELSCGAAGDCAAVGDYVDDEGMTRAMIVQATGTEEEGPVGGGGGGSGAGGGGEAAPPSGGTQPPAAGVAPQTGKSSARARRRALKKCRKLEGKARKRCVRKVLRGNGKKKRGATASTLLGAAATSGRATSASAAVVLGGKVYGGDHGDGWGLPRPDTIFNGGVPSGLISDVHWSSWGGPVAYGRGRHPIYKPNGGYYGHRVIAHLKATQIGTCEGRDAYLKLLIREPRRPGGPLGAWHSWSGPQTICEPYGSYLAR